MAAAIYPSTGPAEAFNGFVATDFKLDSKAANTKRAIMVALVVARSPSAQNASPTREIKARRITGLLFCISVTKSFKTSSGTGRFSRRWKTRWGAREEARVGKAASFVSFASNAGTDFTITVETRADVLRTLNMEYKILRSGPIAFPAWASLRSSVSAASLLSSVALSTVTFKRVTELARISELEDVEQLKIGIRIRRMTPILSG